MKEPTSEYKSSYKNSYLTNSILRKHEKKLISYSHHLVSLLKSKDFSKPEASILLTSSTEYIKQSKSLARKLATPDLIIVIGIGGSNLGAKAIFDALRGKDYNLFSKNKPKMLFADSVDSSYLDLIIKFAEDILKNNGHVVVNTVSKSGGTLETIANLALIKKSFDKLKKANVDYVFTTDTGSNLDLFADKNGFDVLHIPKSVGGRYSVFSNAGLFPLSLSKFDTSKLLKGASLATKSLNDTSINSDYFKMSVFLYQNYLLKKNIHVNFIFSKRLESMGLWYRQLMAESIAKREGINKREINSGITPLVSIGSVDLHSMAQLYLGGPADKTFKFISLRDEKSAQILNSSILDSLYPRAKNKKTTQILNSILDGVKYSFSNQGIPFVSESISLTESSLGYKMQNEMLHIMFLAKLMGINAFNQPEVENYKMHTKRILKNLG